MAFLHEQSCECVKSELDLFAVPPTQTSVQEGQWIEYHPLSTISDSGPIEFAVSGSGEDYFDLAESRLYVRAKVVNADGTNLADDADVGPVNLWLHSLFSQIDMSLNEKLVTASNNTYPYRAYLETLLNYGSDAKKTQLESALWNKDTAGKLDEVTGDNDGFTSRKAYIERSRAVDMMGRLHLDMFAQQRYLLNGVNVKLRLVRSKSEFALMSHADNVNYRVSILSASLFMRKVKLSPAVQLGHIKALESGTAKYPVRRVETKVLTVPRGNLMSNQENLFLGQLPKRILIGMVDNDAFNGTYAKNPFHFKHNNVDFVALYVDGRQVPSKPLQPNFQRQDYIRCYTGLFSGIGKAERDEGNDITRNDYANGYTVFAFDLTPDMTDGDHFNLVKNGSLRLEIHFARALQETVNIVVYAEFENLIEIDRSRNVLFDFTS